MAAATTLAPSSLLPLSHSHLGPTLTHHNNHQDEQEQRYREGVEALHRRSWSTSAVNYGIALDRSALFQSLLLASSSSASSSSSISASQQRAKRPSRPSRATAPFKTAEAKRRPSYTTSSNYTATVTTTPAHPVTSPKPLSAQSTTQQRRTVVAATSAKALAYTRLQARNLQSGGLSTHTALEIGSGETCASTALRIAAENPNVGYTLLIDDDDDDHHRLSTTGTDRTQVKVKASVAKAGLSHRISVPPGQIMDNLNKISTDIKRGIKTPFGLVLINMSLFSFIDDEARTREVVDKALDITIEGGSIVFDNVVTTSTSTSTGSLSVGSQELLERLRSHARVENGFQVSALDGDGDGSEDVFVCVTVH